MNSKRLSFFAAPHPAPIQYVRNATVAGWQADLFPVSTNVEDRTSIQPEGRGGSGRIASAPSWPMPSLADMADILEGSGDYRVLRRLTPRALVPIARPLPPGKRVGVIVDTETTGLDHAKDEVIELGMVAFTYDEEAVLDLVGVFSALREPTVEISAEITRITGILPEMVAGQAIDLDEVAAFIEDADLVVAHNARFDRPFCERLAPGFDYKPWACSVSEIDWASLGFEGAKLAYLVGQCGWFHQGHRAVDDCHALLEVLASSPRAGGPSPFSQLVSAAARMRLRVWAEGSPFHTKEVLKARGYRWSDGSDGRPKSWWIEIEEDAHAEELIFLREQVYGRECEPWVERLTACERFKR